MVSKRVWAGRVILTVLIILIMAILGYFLMVNNEQQITNNTVNEAQAASSVKPEEVSKMVKSAYEAYAKTAYNENRPNPMLALSQFKSKMTTEGAKKMGNYSQNKDPVLCTAGAPEDLNYTKPTEFDGFALITVVSETKDGTMQVVVEVDSTLNKITSVSCK